MSRKEGGPGRKMLASRATVLGCFGKSARECCLGGHSRFPRRPTSQPVVCGHSIVVSACKALLRALNHAPFTRAAADQNVDYGPGNRCSLQSALCLGKCFAGLEAHAQEMVGSNETDSPSPQYVDGGIIWSQPWSPSAPPRWGLIDAGGEPSASRCRQNAGIARPRHTVEFASAASHPCHFNVSSKPRKRPVERPDKPRHVILLTGERRAAPLITAIEKPDTGKAERSCNGINFRGIRRTASLEPKAC